MPITVILSRIDTLRRELEKGQRELERVERERQELRDTLLRISGAVQVLEELLAAEPGAPPAGPEA